MRFRTSPHLQPTEITQPTKLQLIKRLKLNWLFAGGIRTLALAILCGLW
jgi:hypothetical protein